MQVKGLLQSKICMLVWGLGSWPLVNFRSSEIIFLAILLH